MLLKWEFTPLYIVYKCFIIDGSKPSKKRNILKTKHPPEMLIEIQGRDLLI